jgi:hypothetical protein
MRKGFRSTLFGSMCALVGTVAAGCGGGASLATFNSALKAPNATITETSAAAAVTTSEQSAYAGSAPGTPNFGFLLPADINPGISLNPLEEVISAETNIADAYTTACKIRPSYSATISGSQLGAAYASAGCTAAGSFTLSYECKNDNKAIQYKFSYNAFSLDCTSGEMKGSFAINGDGLAQVGANKAGDKFLMRAFYNLTGSATDSKGVKTSYDYEGGGGALFSLPDFKAIVYAVVVAVDGKYAVFASADKNNPTLSRAGITGRNVIIQGGNGKFVANCQKVEGSTKCALWNHSTKELVASQLTPTPTFPAGADEITLDLSALAEE